jgi:hypothetical protein
MPDPLLGEYRDSHERCAICLTKGGPHNPLEIHHIVSRGYKKELTNDHRNLLVLCRDDHYGFHSGGGRSLSLGNLLYAKELLGELDLAFLASLKSRKGLREDPAEFPLWVLDERKDNGIGWWKTK